MESRFQTSFIPKKPIEPVSTNFESHGKQPIGFFFSLSVFILILTLIGAGGTFFYSKILDKQLVNLQQSINSSEKEFDPSLVTELQRLDQRIDSSKALLNGHIGFSTFFSLLQNITLKTIQYTSFQYSNQGPGKVAITLKGTAKDYASVARQSEVISDAQYTNGSLKSPIFSDLNLDTAGNVIFSLTALIDPNLISYKKNLLAAFSQSNATATDNTEQPNQTQSDVISNP